MRYEAIFLDRDGVLNVELFDFVTRPEDLELERGAAEAVRRLNEAGLPVVVVTNQSGIGRGLFTETDLRAVLDKLEDELAAGGARLDAIYYCHHGPDEGCDCRKPLPGMLKTAGAELGFDPAKTVLVGDTIRDLEAAIALGAETILVRTGKGATVEATLPGGEVQPDAVVDDIAAAVDWILARCES